MARVVCRSLEPVVGRSPRVLILGSMPGVRSLVLRQYYGHPQNRFWDLVGAAIGRELRGVAYAERLRRLKAARIALWDSIAECERPGSLDSRIRGERPNAIGQLLRRHPTIRAVFFNGSKSWAAFRKHHAAGRPPFDRVALARLPSSSPANASIPWPAKRRAWSRIAAYLDGRVRSGRAPSASAAPASCC